LNRSFLTIPAISLKFSIVSFWLDCGIRERPSSTQAGRLQQLFDRLVIAG